MRRSLRAALVAGMMTATAAQAQPSINWDGMAGTFANPDVFDNPFTDTLTFNLGMNGLLSGTISSTAQGRTTDIDFTSVTINGVEFTIQASDGAEFRFFNDLPVMAGLQTLVISGTSGGDGAYSGTLAFDSGAAIPEPAAWTMMVVGFGLLGAGLRRQKARVRYV